MFHHFGNQSADLAVFGRKGRNFSYLLVVINKLALFLKRLYHGMTRLAQFLRKLDHVESFFADHLFAFINHRVRENRRSRRTVTYAVVRFIRGLLDEFRADIFPFVLELDLLRNRHAVKRHLRRAVALFDNHRTSPRTKRHLDRLGQFINTLFDRRTRVFVEFNLFCHSIFLSFPRRRGSMLSVLKAWVLASARTTTLVIR